MKKSVSRRPCVISSFHAVVIVSTIDQFLDSFKLAYATVDVGNEFHGT